MMSNSKISNSNLYTPPQQATPQQSDYLDLCNKFDVATRLYQEREALLRGEITSLKASLANQMGVPKSNKGDLKRIEEASANMERKEKEINERVTSVMQKNGALSNQLKREKEEHDAVKQLLQSALQEKYRVEDILRCTEAEKHEALGKVSEAEAKIHSLKARLDLNEIELDEHKVLLSQYSQSFDAPPHFGASGSNNNFNSVSKALSTAPNTDLNNIFRSYANSSSNSLAETSLLIQLNHLKKLWEKECLEGKQARQQVRDMEKQLAESKEAIETATSRHEEELKEVSTKAEEILRRKADQLEKDISTRSEESVALSEANRELVAQVRELESKCKWWKEMADELRDAATAQSEQTHQAGKQLSTTADECESLRVFSREINKKLLESGEENVALQKHVAALQENIEDLNDRIAYLTQPPPPSSDATTTTDVVAPIVEAPSSPNSGVNALKRASTSPSLLRPSPSLPEWRLVDELLHAGIPTTAAAASSSSSPPESSSGLVDGLDEGGTAYSGGGRRNRSRSSTPTSNRQQEQQQPKRMGTTPASLSSPEPQRNSSTANLLRSSSPSPTGKGPGGGGGGGSGGASTHNLYSGTGGYRDRSLSPTMARSSSMPVNSNSKKQRSPQKTPPHAATPAAATDAALASVFMSSPPPVPLSPSSKTRTTADLNGPEPNTSQQYANTSTGTGNRGSYFDNAPSTPPREGSRQSSATNSAERSGRRLRAVSFDDEHPPKDRDDDDELPAASLTAERQPQNNSSSSSSSSVSSSSKPVRQERHASAGAAAANNPFTPPPAAQPRQQLRQKQQQQQQQQQSPQIPPTQGTRLDSMMETDSTTESSSVSGFASDIHAFTAADVAAVGSNNDDYGAEHDPEGNALLLAAAQKSAKQRRQIALGTYAKVSSSQPNMLHGTLPSVQRLIRDQQEQETLRQMKQRQKAEQQHEMRRLSSSPSRAQMTATANSAAVSSSPAGTASKSASVLPKTTSWRVENVQGGHITAVSTSPVIIKKRTTSPAAAAAAAAAARPWSPAASTKAAHLARHESFKQKYGTPEMKESDAIVATAAAAASSGSADGRNGLTITAAGASSYGGFGSFHGALSAANSGVSPSRSRPNSPSKFKDSPMKFSSPAGTIAIITLTTPKPVAPIANSSPSSSTGLKRSPSPMMGAPVHNTMPSRRRTTPAPLSDAAAAAVQAQVEAIEQRNNVPAAAPTPQSSSPVRHGKNGAGDE